MQDTSIQKWLNDKGIAGTEDNVRLYNLGRLIVLVSFTLVICQMIDLGFCSLHCLARLSHGMRFLGTAAPFALPGLLSLALRRRLPGLATGLFDGGAVIALLWLPIYGIGNLLVAVSTY